MSAIWAAPAFQSDGSSGQFTKLGSWCSGTSGSGVRGSSGASHTRSSASATPAAAVAQALAGMGRPGSTDGISTQVPSAANRNPW